jgi:hypothetical protein
MKREELAGYLWSIPERVLRSVSAVAGGTVQELGDVLLPARVRRSRLYHSLVGTTARFLVEQLGQVKLEQPGRIPLPEDFVVRRAVGNVVEIAGLAAFRASPVWVLAALSDVAGAGRELVAEIALELQREGLLEQGRTFDSVDQVLDGLERTCGRLAEAVNTPPLNVDSLRQEWGKLRSEAAQIPRASLPSPTRLWNQWTELKAEAAAQDRSVVELSSVIALATIRQLPEDARWLSNAVRIGSRRTGEVLARGLLDHYRVTLAEIRKTGYVCYWLREFRPYLKGAIRQFSPSRGSTTQRLRARRKGRKATGPD